KPESCVQIGDLKAEIALNQTRPEPERLAAARQANDAYNRALQIDPKFLPGYLGLARLAMGLNEYESANKAYDTAAARFPKEAGGWYERGMCFGRQRRFDEALTSLDRAARIDPKNSRYTKTLGLMMARAGRSEEAVPWLARSMPEADARYNVAKMMEHIG